MLQVQIWVKEADPSHIPAEVQLSGDREWHVPSLQQLREEGELILSGEEAREIVLRPGKTFPFIARCADM